MRIRSALAAAALAAAAAGCGGKDKCPTESPNVNAMPQSCTAVAGQTVSYPLQLCPTCNQTFSACDVTVSGNDIFLNPTVEACSSSSSCPLSCSATLNVCTFVAPSSGGPFTVSVYDPASGQTKTGTLAIVLSGPSCAI